MRYRSFVAIVLLALIVLVSCTEASVAPPSDSPAPSPFPSPIPDERPNILIVFVDDLRGLPLDVLRAVMPVTMHWMADGGTYFPNAFVPNPVCCPARASLFTGQYSHNNGVLRNGKPEVRKFDHETSLQHDLRAAGYQTAIVGKFFNQWDITQPPPYFDKWALAQSVNDETAYYGRTFSVNGTIVTLPRYTTDVQARQAVQFLRGTETQDEQPWFLHVAPNAPHQPFIPKHEYEKAIVPDWYGNPSRDEADISDKPRFIRSNRLDRAAIDLNSRNQLRMLMSVDDLVDRIFSALREQGELNRTLVVFTSDNGFLWGEHGLTGKQKPYTESINVPFFLRWPGHIAQDAVDERLTAIIDVAPTVADAAELSFAVSDGRLNAYASHVPYDGKSLLAPAERDRILFEAWSGNPGPEWLSTRTATYQYIEWYDASGRVIFREYYDLIADPWQEENLLADADPANDPDVVALSHVLTADAECAGVTCP